MFLIHVLDRVEPLFTIFFTSGTNLSIVKADATCSFLQFYGSSQVQMRECSPRGGGPVRAQLFQILTKSKKYSISS